jgi:hypothetical protein
MPPLAAAAVPAIGFALMDIGVGGAAAGIIAQAAGAAIPLVATAGLAYASQLLMPDPAAASGALKTRVSEGEAVPRVMAFGRVCSAGHRVYSNIWGNDGRHLQVVYRLADHPCHQLVAVIADGKKRDLEPESGSTWYQVQGFDGRFRIRFWNGDPDQLASNALKVRANPGSRWGDDDRLRQVCYVECEFQYRAKTFPGGAPPALRFVFDGGLWYDPRKDTTVGGSGPHRWADRSTWEFTENPAVAAYNYRRGNWANGRLWGGVGAPLGEDDIESYQVAADACDEVVTNPDDTTRPRYRVSFIAEAGHEAQHGANMDAILAACAGLRAERRGQIWIAAGVARAPVRTITDADLRLGADRVTAPKRAAGQKLMNELHGTYTSSKKDWVQKSLPPLIGAADRTADGRRLHDSRDFAQVTDEWQARALMQIAYDLSRLQHREEVPAQPWLGNLDPGDIVQWQSDRYGWTKSFIVEGYARAGNPTRDVTLTLQEYSAGPFDPDLDGDAEGAPIEPGGPGDPFPPQNFDADPAEIAGPGGTKKAAMALSWDPPDDVRVEDLVVQIGTGATPTVVGQKVLPAPEAGAATISEGLGLVQTYKARAAFRRAGDRAEDLLWTDWIEVVSEGDIGPGIPGIIDDIGAIQVDLTGLHVDVDAARAQADAARDEAGDARTEADAARVEAAAAADLARQEGSKLRRALSDSAAIRATAPSDYNIGLHEQLSSIAATIAMMELELAQTKGALAQGIDFDAQNGRIRIYSVQALEQVVSSVQISLNSALAEISLRATKTEVSAAIEAVIAGFEPVVRWEFPSTTESWSVANGTLTANGSGQVALAVTTAPAAITSPAIAVDASVNRMVSIVLRRTAGTGWGGTLEWQTVAGGSTWYGPVALAVPADPSSDRRVSYDMAEEAAWTGTVKAIRYKFGESTSDAFLVDRVEIGASSLSDLLLSDLTGRVQAAEVRISAAESAITLKADDIDLQEERNRINQAEVDISALTAEVALKANSITVDDQGTRLSLAEAQIAALDGGEFSVSLLQGRKIQDLENWQDIVNSALLDAFAGVAESNSERERQIAFARQEMTAKVDAEGVARAASDAALVAIVDGAVATIRTQFVAQASALSAEVLARQALNVRMGAAEAAIVSETAARATADSAIISAANSLTARVGTAEVGLASEITARVTADNALISDLSVLTTRVGDAEGGLANEVIVRADADSALASQITTLTASLGTTNAAIATEQTVRATADTALTNSLTSLTSRVGTAETAITTEQTTRATADTALSNSISSLTSRVGAAESAITTEQTTRATADTALSNSLTSLSARVGTAESAIATEQTARATADTALTNSITSLTARVGTAEGAITTEQTARVNADNVLTASVSSLTSRMGAAEGAITTEQAARASADSSLASRIDTVTAAFGGNTSEVKCRFQASADQDGALARLELRVRVASNNNPSDYIQAGMIIQATSTAAGAGSVLFDTSRFQIGNLATKVIPFRVAGTDIYLQNVITERIQSPDGRLDIDVRNGQPARILISD